MTLTFELKISESEPKNLNEAYTRALRLEMIRKKVQKRISRRRTGQTWETHAGGGG